MELDVIRPQKVLAKTVRVLAKIVDNGHYALLDQSGDVLANRDDYVPGFFPGEHYGDYLMLDIELDTGIITNWGRPQPADVVKAFFPEDEQT